VNLLGPRPPRPATDAGKFQLAPKLSETGP